MACPQVCCPEEAARKLIIVTGFGPFANHEEVNASWEAVRLLPDELLVNGETYTLEKQEIPVEYAAVDVAVRTIWQRQPELVIHCGVHGKAKCVHIESRAYNHQFTGTDYAGKTLATPTACLVNCRRDNGGGHVICTRLCVRSICEAIRRAGQCECGPTTTNTVGGDESGAAAAAAEEPPLPDNCARTSNNVGSYLCGYIYLKSLDQNASRTLFVHVPPIDKPYSSPETARIVRRIIEECVRQIQAKQQQIQC